MDICGQHVVLSSILKVGLKVAWLNLWHNNKV